MNVGNIVRLYHDWVTIRSVDIPSLRKSRLVKGNLATYLGEFVSKKMNFVIIMDDDGISFVPGVLSKDLGIVLL